MADFVGDGAQPIVCTDAAAGMNTRRGEARRAAFLEQKDNRVLRFSNAGLVGKQNGIADLVLMVFALSPCHADAPGALLSPPKEERK